MGMIVGVPKESFPGERRVALVPSVIPSLTAKSYEVVVESGAGATAGHPDGAYREREARLCQGQKSLLLLMTGELPEAQADQDRAAGQCGQRGHQLRLKRVAGHRASPSGKKCNNGGVKGDVAFLKGLRPLFAPGSIEYHAEKVLFFTEVRRK